MNRVAEHALIFLLAVSLPIGVAAADIIHLKGGKSVEGKVLEDDPSKPEIKVKVQ